MVLVDYIGIFLHVAILLAEYCISYMTHTLYDCIKMESLIKISCICFQYSIYFHVYFKQDWVFSEILQHFLLECNSQLFMFMHRCDKDYSLNTNFDNISVA